MATYRRAVITVSIPDNLVADLHRISQTENISLSWAAAKTIAIGLGYGKDYVREGKRPRHREYTTTLTEAKKAAETQPHPENFLAVYDEPVRPAFQYAALLAPNAHWGNGKPVTDTEREQLAYLRDKFGVASQ